MILLRAEGDGSCLVFRSFQPGGRACSIWSGTAYRSKVGTPQNPTRIALGFCWSPVAVILRWSHEIFTI